MTMSPTLPAPRSDDSRARHATSLPLALALALVAALASASHPSSAAAQGGGASDGDVDPRSIADLARRPRAPAGHGASMQARVATPLNSSIVTPNDTFLVVSSLFQDLAGNPPNVLGSADRLVDFE